MTVAFPKTTFSIVRGQSLLTSVDQRVLIVGQKLSSGTAAAGALLQDVGTSVSEINGLFGPRSHLAEMVREFRAINGQTPLDVIPLDDDGGATQGAGAITFTGTATETGTLWVEVGSGSRYRFAIPITNGDTAATVATALAALVTANAQAPFSAVATTGTVDFTAANSGSISNNWMIYTDGAVAGLATSISGFAGGATDPTVTNTLLAAGNIRYQTIVWPEVYGDTVVESFLDGRFNADGELLQGVAFIAFVEASTTAAIARSNALQSPSVVGIFSKDISRDGLVGGQHREFPDVLSAKAAALRSLRFTDNASLSEFLSTPASLDQFGGRALATLPYANTVVTGLVVLSPADDLTRLEMDSLREGGVSTIGPNRSFSAMVLSEFVTTSNKNNSGDPDPSFKFLNTVDAASVVRDAFFLNSRIRFAQSRITEGDLVPGRDLVNQASFEAFTEEVFLSLADDGIVAAGQESLADFKRQRIVTLTISEGKITFSCAPILVSGLRVILGTIEINLG